MNNKILIIEPTGKCSKMFNTKDLEKQYLMLYLEKNNLTFKGYKQAKKDFLSLYLAGLNYIVIFIDDSNSFLYIGDSITKEQKKTLSKNKLKDKLIEIKSITYFDNSKLLNDLERVEYFYLGKTIMN